jgi:hypothetical protein
VRQQVLCSVPITAISRLPICSHRVEKAGVRVVHIKLFNCMMARAATALVA